MGFLAKIADKATGSLVDRGVDFLFDSIFGGGGGGGPRPANIPYRGPAPSDFVSQMAARKDMAIAPPTPTPVAMPSPESARGIRSGEYNQALLTALNNIRNRWGGGSAGPLAQYSPSTTYAPPMPLGPPPGPARNPMGPLA